MANEQRPIVNQRLYFCRLHLEYLAVELDRQQTPKVVVEQSLGESIVLHLVLAYRAYLREIAIAYAIPGAAYTTASDLIAALYQSCQQSAEAKELAALEQDGWLCELLTRYCALGSVEAEAKDRPASASGITVMQIDDKQPLDLALCRHYLQSLNELIENQRSRLEEW